ncbi:hypothetical protein [Nonomuraea sp. NPDC049695]|uniref:hypothetical protein n=1 Tax=Nonomuraea sp. NPDC049695 TaxID=3154734 RepID=UPI00341E1C31
MPAPVTTMAWRLAHIIVSCLGYRVGWHFGGQDVDFQTFAYAGTADERFPMEGIVELRKPTWTP